MRRLNYFLSVLLIASRRLWHQRGLALSLLLGLTAAVALTVSIPLYADAISHRILNEKLSNIGGNLPPFSFLFRYVGSWHGFLEWEACTQINNYITGQAASTLGLQPELLVRYFKTDKMHLLASADAAYQDKRKPLSYVSLGFISDLEPKVELLDGRFPQPVTNNSDAIEVMAPLAMVEQLGLQAGEKYIVYYDEPLFQHTVHLVGVWQAQNPNDPYWFYQSSAFDEVLLMPEDSYVQMSKAMKGEVELAMWSLVFRDPLLRSQNVSLLLDRIAVLRNQVGPLLSNVEFSRSPEKTLLDFESTLRLLTLSLYMFGVPILGLVLYFISLISGMIVQRQRNEVAMLRSRGMATGQIVGIYLLEGLIVGILSMVAGAFLGERFAQAMGLTRSFLVWENRPLLPTVFSWETLRFGVLAIGAAIWASIGPALNASRDTIVTYKRDLSRSLKAPWWKRSFIDVFLFLPALYGYYILSRRGAIASLSGKGAVAATAVSSVGSALNDPFLFIVPVIFAFALSLFSIRLFPTVMQFLAWLSGLVRGAVPVLAMRHLARTAQQYTGPLLLLILTLSLAVFTASMSRTLDDYIVSKVYYNIGADFRLIELGQNLTTTSDSVSASNDSTEDNTSTAVDSGPLWLFMPVSEHLNIAGVQAATRVWQKEVTVKLQEENVDAQMMGIDRIDFPKVSFFRSDFAPAQLGALMNALAVRNDAVLVSQDILESGLKIGDKINISIPAGDNPKVDFAIVGVVDMFPRLYPEDGPFFIVNLDFIFDTLGATYPYDVWLKTFPSVDAKALEDGARELDINTVDIYDARAYINDIQLTPERQGIFGLLSIGFIVSAALTLLGFLIYSYIAFQQRYIELGMLRALGLSMGQMALLLVVEQLVIILIGAGIGTGLGYLVSKLFIPFFQMEGGAHPLTPPFVVQIAWTEITYIYVVFGAMFLAAVIALLLVLRRMRVFEAIKLGEVG